jgi:hypothetical protein
VTACLVDVYFTLLSIPYFRAPQLSVSRAHWEAYRRLLCTQILRSIRRLTDTKTHHSLAHAGAHRNRHLL